VLVPIRLDGAAQRYDLDSASGGGEQIAGIHQNVESARYPVSVSVMTS
jgi:hypothetical protein